MLYNQTYASNTYHSSAGLVEIDLTWNNNQVSWYATVNSGFERYGPIKQANGSGETYRYCIIGLYILYRINIQSKIILVKL